MTWHPGDSNRRECVLDLGDLAIIDVEPVELDRPATVRTWPCASCGRWHDISASFVVHHHDNGRVRTAYVCDGCAEPLLEEG